MALSEIFCQDKAIGSLQRAYAAGRMAHAYLFEGADGVGKRTTARAWAKMLLCENKQTVNAEPAFVDSCGVCHACQTFDAGGHPDFRPIYKELVQFTAKGKNKKTPVDMPIDVIREFLIDKVSSRPTMGDFVVYVVDEAEKVNASSQNALLKVLEEPPAYCVIILLCSRIDKMLPTTLSRCQLVRFGPVSTEQIVGRLTAEGVNEAEAVFWSHFSQGSLGSSLVWSQLQTKDSTVYAIKQQLLEKLCTLQLPDVVDMAEWMGKSAKAIAAAWGKQAENVSTTDITRRSQKALVQMITCALHDVIKLHVGQAEGWVHADQKQCVQALAGRTDAETAARQIEQCCQITRWIDASVNEKLIFEQLLLKLTLNGSEADIMA